MRSLSAVEEQAAFATSGAYDWEHFQIGTDHFLAVANFRNDRPRSRAAVAAPRWQRQPAV